MSKYKTEMNACSFHCHEYHLENNQIIFYWAFLFCCFEYWIKLSESSSKAGGKLIRKGNIECGVSLSDISILQIQKFELNYYFRSKTLRRQANEQFPAGSRFTRFHSLINIVSLYCVHRPRISKWTAGFCFVKFVCFPRGSVGYEVTSLSNSSATPYDPFSFIFVSERNLCWQNFRKLSRFLSRLINELEWNAISRK